MTHDELTALPTMGGMGLDTHVLADGTRVSVPVFMPLKALWTAEDEPAMICDAHGQWWRVGWAAGRQWKVRMGEETLPP